MKKWIVLASFIVLLAFQNCGINLAISEDRLDLSSEVAKVEVVSSTGDTCEDMIYNEYKKAGGYFATLTSQDCAGCHHDQQNDRPKLASLNTMVAWSAFKQKELEEGHKISENLIGAHQASSPRTQNSELVARLKSDMAVQQEQYISCKGGATDTKYYQFTSPEVELRALAVADAPTDDDKNIKTTVAGKTTGLTTDTTNYSVQKYQRLVYDKATKKNKIIDIPKYAVTPYAVDLASGQYSSTYDYKPPMTYKFELHPYVTVTAVKETIASVEYIVNYKVELQPYFAIKNLTLKLNQASTSLGLSVKKMNFQVDQKLIADATVYTILNVNICTNTDVKLMPSASEQLIILDKLELNSKMSFVFDSVVPMQQAQVRCTTNDGTDPDFGLPETIKFEQLADVKSEFGVFAKNCFSCHSGSTAQAGLDLTNYTAAKARSEKIQSRMNDIMAPMPRSGLLSARERAVVDLWIAKGTPQ